VAGGRGDSVGGSTPGLTRGEMTRRRLLGSCVGASAPGAVKLAGALNAAATAHLASPTRRLAGNA
jgi:hypothetical protein